MICISVLIKINDVGKRYKVSKRSLRYYEEIGLIESRREGASRCRVYDEAAIHKLERIILLRSVNFSIEQISQLLLYTDSETVLNIFKKRLEEIDEKLKEYSYYRTVVGSFIDKSKSIGISNVNLYQLLKDQIFSVENNRRMKNMEDKYHGDVIRLEFGLGIVPLVDPNDQTGFLHAIKSIRNRLETENGSQIPLIRVCDSDVLHEFQYRIIVKSEILVDKNLSDIAPEKRATDMLYQLENTLKLKI